MRRSSSAPAPASYRRSRCARFLDRDVTQEAAGALRLALLLDGMREAHRRIGLKALVELRHTRIGAAVDGAVEVVPARDAGEVGVGEARFVAEQPRAPLQHGLEIGVGLGDLGAAIRVKRASDGRVVDVLQRVPERGEGGKQAGVEEGQHLVEAVKAVAALRIAQPRPMPRAAR